MFGNKGYGKYRETLRDSVTFDQCKIKSDSRFNGKWEVRTVADLWSEKVE
jgi:hypothetical protein